MSSVFEEKEIEVGDVAVQVRGGCEDCDCDNLGKPFRVGKIEPPTHTNTGVVFCKKGIAFYVTDVVYGTDGTYYIKEWLAIYKHFKNWYPKWALLPNDNPW